MASVTSLDGDLRKLRLDKYTPGAAREARAWIESVLGEPLAGGDLLEALRDGVALCRLANLALPPPGIRFKTSAMPFVQMENISHFLRACQAPPLNLQQHDTFLTVDLYEAKDPAQVLQCLGAFSRAANRANPAAFPTAMGPRPGAGGVSPQSTGGRGRAPPPTSPPGRPAVSAIYGGRTPLAPAHTGNSSDRDRSTSPTKSSPGRSPTSTSTWSRRDLEGSTAPAWNIAQYGYMGGASQGNLGISFGGRRQITSAGPYVPNAAEKERQRKEKAAEEARRQEAAEAAEAEARARRAEEEERARRAIEDEQRRQRDEEKRRAEEERRRWAEEERQWKLTEEARRREEEEAEARLAEERQQRLQNLKSGSGSGKGGSGGGGDARLRGQFLSQYQAKTQASAGAGTDADVDGGAAYSSRVRELEKELELARQREQAYERERQGRSRANTANTASSDAAPPDARAHSRSRGPRSRSRPRALPDLGSPPTRQESWSRNDEQALTPRGSQSRHRFADQASPSALDTATDVHVPPPSKSPRPLPDPRQNFQSPPPPPQPQQQQPPQLPSRQLPSANAFRQEPTMPSSPPQQQPSSSGPTSFFQKIRTHRTGEKAASADASGSSSPLRQQRTGDGPNKLTKTHGRPLPDPSSYATPRQQQQPLSPSPQPQQQQQQQQQQQPPPPTYSRELLGGGVAEHDAEDRRRRQQAYRPQQQQQPLIKQRQPPPQAAVSAPASASTSTSPFRGATGAASGASRPGMSLLEREMELERQRQREWEEAQRATAAAPRRTDNVDGVDGRWDVNQWSGYTGGDSQNRGSQGIGAGRRQIVGPRPLPGQR